MHGLAHLRAFCGRASLLLRSESSMPVPGGSGIVLKCGRWWIQTSNAPTIAPPSSAADRAKKSAAASTLGLQQQVEHCIRCYAHVSAQDFEWRGMKTKAKCHRWMRLVAATNVLHCSNFPVSAVMASSLVESEAGMEGVLHEGPNLR